MSDVSLSRHGTSAAAEQSFSVAEILNGSGPRVNDHHGGRHNTYMAHKITKLGDQNHAAANSTVSNIFVGCAVFVNGYTDPPVNELKRLIAVNGGRFNQYETSDTTHFACNHYPQIKIDRLRKGLEKRKIFYVTIKWITDSVAAGYRLRETDYRPEGLFDASSHKLFDVGGVRLTGGKRKTPSESHDALTALASIDQFLNAAEQWEPDSAPTIMPASEAFGALKGADAANPRNAENDPNFIEHFFESSRLHFIGTWRSRLPTLYEECMSATAPVHSNARIREPASGSLARVVLHVDMDCFFVSVLLRDRPELRDLPVAVAHSKSSSQRGFSEISSCNYPARADGLKNGMFMHQAVKLCPHLNVLQYDFAQYTAVSEQVYRIMFATSNIGATVQPLSVDEAYIELPAGTDGYKVGIELRAEIKAVTECAASVGVGSNMLTARLATKRAKPDGIFVLTEDILLSHLSSMPIGDLPGVGYKHAKVLREKGCTECKDIWPLPKSILANWLGESLGAQVYNYSRGIDDRKLKPVIARKSVGVDINYGIRFTTLRAAEDFLIKLSHELATRLQQANSWGRTVTLKLMVRRWEVNRETPKFLGHGSCDSKSRSTTVVTPVHKADELSVIVLELFQQMTSEFAKRVIPLMRADSLLSVTLQDAALQVVEDLRGVGIQVSRLSQIGAHEPERSTQNVEKHSTIGIPQYINSSADASASSTVHKQHKVNHKLVIQKEHFFDREDESLSEEEDAISGDEVLNVNMSYTSPAASSRQNLRGGAVSFAREAPANDSSDNKNFDSDYVTSSQFDFFMSVAEGAPELLSQVKEQIIAASRKELTNPLFGGATRKAAGSAVLVQASSNGLKDGQIGKRFSDRYSFPRRLESPRWPREPIVNVYKSLLEWVRFACSLKEDSEDQNADSVQNRDTFPSDDMISVLCEYAMDLVRTKQADQAIRFAEVVKRAFSQQGLQFELAVQRVRSAVLEEGRVHCFGTLQLLS